MKLTDYNIEWVFVEVTNACNMHCTFCPSDLITRKRCSMSPEIFRKTIDQLSDLNVHRPIGLHVVGEPLLNKHIFEYIDYCNGKDIYISLFTNGVLLPEKMEEICKRENILCLTISLQTPNDHTYKMRGSPLSFETYLTGIFNSLEYIIKTKTNKRMRVEVHLADTRNIPYWHVLDDHREAEKAMCPLAEKANFICKQYDQPWVLPPMPKNLLDYIYEAGPNIHFCFKLLSKWGALVPSGYRIVEAKPPLECPHAGKMLCILADGTITVCCLDADGELSLGNIREMSLSDALNSDARKNLLLDVSASKNCRKCKGDIFKNLNSSYSIEDYGFYSIEDWSGTPTRWMEVDATIVVNSPENRTATLSLNVQSFYRNRTLEVYADDELLTKAAVLSNGFVKIDVPINLVKGLNAIELRVPEGCERPSDIKKLNNHDKRCLSVAVQNLYIM